MQMPTETDTETDTQPSTFTSTGDMITSHRKRGKQAFEKTHERSTYWVRKDLKRGLERLARQEEMAQATLLNEAIADLLKKYGYGQEKAAPPT